MNDIQSPTVSKGSAKAMSPSSAAGVLGKMLAKLGAITSAMSNAVAARPVSTVQEVATTSLSPFWSDNAM